MKNMRKMAVSYRRRASMTELKSCRSSGKRSRIVIARSCVTSQKTHIVEA